MKRIKTFIRYFAIAFTVTFAAFLLVGCANVTQTDLLLPDGTRLSSGKRVKFDLLTYKTASGEVVIRNYTSEADPAVIDAQAAREAATAGAVAKGVAEGIGAAAIKSVKPTP